MSFENLLKSRSTAQQRAMTAPCALCRPVSREASDGRAMVDIATPWRTIIPPILAALLDAVYAVAVTGVGLSPMYLKDTTIQDLPI
jgi:hypothetical protein